MKTANKAIASFFTIVVVLFSVSCSKDSNGFIPTESNSVSYFFQMDEASITGLSASITYMTQVTTTETFEYSGTYEWSTTYNSISLPFTPFMGIEIKKGDVDPKKIKFPATLKFTAKLISGGVNGINPSYTFKDIDAFNKYFETFQNRYTLSAVK
ncbi:MAG: hypothetical protein RR293_01530 [Bacteroidales bacterium]